MIESHAEITSSERTSQNVGPIPWRQSPRLMNRRLVQGPGSGSSSRCCRIMVRTLVSECRDFQDWSPYTIPTRRGASQNNMLRSHMGSAFLRHLQNGGYFPVGFCLKPPKKVHPQKMPSYWLGISSVSKKGCQDLPFHKENYA